MGFKIRNPFGVVEDTDNVYSLKNADGEIVTSDTPYSLRDAFGNRVLSNQEFQIRNAWGSLSSSISSIPLRNAFGEVDSFTFDSVSPIAFTGNQPAAVRAFAPYSYTPLVTGGTPPYIFTSNTVLPDGWATDPEAGAQTATVPTPDLPGAQTLTVTDANGLQDTLAVNAMTLSPSIIPADNSGTGYLFSGEVSQPSGEQKLEDQSVLAVLFRFDGLSTLRRTVVASGTSDNRSQSWSINNISPTSFDIRISPSWSALFMFTGAEVGKWYLVFAQVTRTADSGRSTIADRCRIWINGVKQDPPSSFGLVSGRGATEPRAYSIGGVSSNRVADIRFGYVWEFFGPVSALPLIDFDNQSIQQQFAAANINPSTGVIDFGGDVGEITPDFFVHGRASEYNDELTNRGALPGIVLANQATGWTETDYAQSLVIVPDTAVANRSSITSDGVTFNFDAAYPSAQFSDGSWWVNGSGDLDIVSMTPASADLDRDWIESDAPGTTGLRWANGAMVNMSNAAKIASNESQGGSAQGFDEFIGNGLSVAYHDAFNVDPGRTGSALTLATGTVLKAVSEARVLYAANGTGQGAGVVRDLVPLTVFNGAPPSGMDFRPGFSGDAPLISIGNSDIDLSGLPNLSAVTSAPGFFSIYNQIKKFQEGALNSIHRSTRNITAENSYGREHSAMTNQACAILCLSAYTTDQKQAMAKAIVQYGIDLADLVEKENSLGTRVRGLGGTGHGRKIVLTMAALLTDNTRLKDALDWAVTDGGFFYEDMQIKQIQQSWIDQWPSSAYTGRLNGGEFFDGLPGPALGDPDWNKRYRHIFSIGSTGANNLLHAVTGLAALWDNDLFRNYMDYYWAFEAARTPAFSGEQSDRLNLTSGESSFYRNFRQTHGGSWTNVGPMGGL